MVETHFGRIRISDSEFHHNMGNGIKTKFVDGKWPMFDERDTFCRATSVGSNTFPTVMSAIPIRGAFNSRCDQVSLHFSNYSTLLSTSAFGGECKTCHYRFSFRIHS